MAASGLLLGPPELEGFILTEESVQWPPSKDECILSDEHRTAWGDDSAQCRFSDDESVPLDDLETATEDSCSSEDDECVPFVDIETVTEDGCSSEDDECFLSVDIQKSFLNEGSVDDDCAFLSQMLGFRQIAGESIAMGFTENRSATFLSSGNACLDFFFHVVPNTRRERLMQLLDAAWKQDALTALKLVMHLRGVRGTGKSDKESFYTAAMWMHSNHPQTLAANAKPIAQFGYFKDLPEIRLRIVEGAEATQIKKAQKEKHNMIVAKAKKKSAGTRTMAFGFKGVYRRPLGYFGRKGSAAREAKRLGILKPREERIAADFMKGKIDCENAAVLRRTRRLEAASRALRRYVEDLNYRALHDQVAQIFADLLSKDLKELKAEKFFSISLAAKWCPSLDSSYDRSTLLCENIARKLFPRDSHPEYAQVEERHYVYRVRERLRKDVLVPLRKALQLPEVYMCANLWSQLPYNRVASVAMKNYKDLFLKHDSERFSSYLQEVAEGKKKIAAGALLPHEIIQQAVQSTTESSASVAELQWKRMAEDMRKEGKLSNSLAVCDVSGSMSGVPMEVCIALGLLVSDISEEPWKGHLITFSANPQLQSVKGESLVERYDFTKTMDWGANTDFQKVFDLILEMAVNCGLESDKMIKQLLVFSDMEFDEASANPWQTDYMVIKKKFRDAGYGEPPKIVFWNLRDSTSTPVLQEESGVAMVSGFSKNTLKLFLDSIGAINPLIVMNKAIEGKLYQDLIIVD
eukprot:Gb_38039 [translate_table: standard]